MVRVVAGVEAIGDTCNFRAIGPHTTMARKTIHTTTFDTLHF